MQVKSVKVKNKIDILIKLLPLTLGFLSVLGYLNIHLYYSFFNIDIINHITLTEIPLLFYDKIILLYGSSLFLILTLFFSNQEKIKNDKKTELELNFLNKKEKENYLSDKFEKIKKNRKKELLILIIIITFLYTGIITYLILTKDYVALTFKIINIIVILLITFSAKFLFRNFLYFFKQLSFEKAIILFMVIIITIFLNIGFFIDTGEHIYKIKNCGETEKNIQFEFKGLLIKTNDDLKYLGQTKNNLFLYSCLNEKSFIYKTTEINKMIIY